MPAGRWTKLDVGRNGLLVRSSFSPDATANCPAITVTNSSFECLWGGTTKPAGNFRRSTNGPSLPGLPRRTAASAPGGRDGGAGPHLTASAATTVWCISVACVDGWRASMAPRPRATAVERITPTERPAWFMAASFPVGFGPRSSVSGDHDLEVLAGHD